jgi:arsenate reductase
LEEIGIDTSVLRSKSIDSFKRMRFDIVVTVCQNAKDTCPFYPYADTYVHQGFVDPSDVMGPPERRLDDFRKSRDDIRKWIDENLDGGDVAEGPRIKHFYPDRIK